MLPDHRPNLFIVGAMKAGSTSLHEYLATHPDCYMSREKEPGYFVSEMRTNHTLESYLELFKDGAGRKYRGESSTHYAKVPTYMGVPARIHDFAPQARIVYIMRDPVARTISHYWHEVKAIYRVAETRPIIKALQAHEPYTAYSDYARQLRAYYDVFSRDSIYCLTLESLLADPALELGRLWSWLGIPPAPIPITEAHNKLPERVRRAAGRGTLNVIAHSRILSPLIRALPERFKGRIRARAYTEITPGFDSSTTADIRNRLISEYQFAEKRDDLERLLGRKFPEWKPYDRE